MANEAGQGCSARANIDNDKTFVSYGAPASIGGSVSRLAAYIGNAAGAATFAFFTASGNNLTTVSGSQTAPLDYGATAECEAFNAPDDFTAFSVSSGNYLGCFATFAQNRSISGGSGFWSLTGDYTNVNGQAFTLDSDGIDALTADITAAGGLSIPIAMEYYGRRRR